MPWPLRLPDCNSFSFSWHHLLPCKEFAPISWISTLLCIHTLYIQVGDEVDCLEDVIYLNDFLDTSIRPGKFFTYFPSLRRLTYGLMPNPFIYALDPSEYEDNTCPCPTLDTLKLHNPRSSIPRSSFLPQILKNCEAVAVPITKQVFSVQQPAYIPSDEKDPGEESDADDD